MDSVLVAEGANWVLDFLDPWLSLPVPYLHLYHIPIPYSKE